MLLLGLGSGITLLRAPQPANASTYFKALALSSELSRTKEDMPYSLSNPAQHSQQGFRSEPRTGVSRLYVYAG